MPRIKLKKGSKEAKAYMASLRGRRGKKFNPLGNVLPFGLAAAAVALLLGLSFPIGAGFIVAGIVGGNVAKHYLLK